MESTARFTFAHVQTVSGFWWSGLLHQPIHVQVIDRPRLAPRDAAGGWSTSDDDWDHLWTDLGGEG